VIVDLHIPDIHSSSTPAAKGGFALVVVLLTVSLLAVISATIHRAGSTQAVVSYNQKSGEDAYYVAAAGVEMAMFRLKKINITQRGPILTNIPFGKGSFSVTVTESQSPAGNLVITSEGRTENSHRIIKKRIQLTGIGVASSALLKDCFIDEQDWIRNFGGSDYILLGGKNSNKAKRGLLEFDLSSIPPGATIASAILELYMYDTNEPRQDIQIEVNVHRVIRSWKEGNKDGAGNSNGASWEEYDGNNLWATPGADFDAAVEASATILSQEKDQWHSWEIASLVQYWVDNPSDHFGMILKDTDEATDGNDSFSGTFYSREATYGNGEFKPRLTVILQ
jgi:hypothetical protein